MTYKPGTFRDLRDHRILSATRLGSMAQIRLSDNIGVIMEITPTLRKYLKTSGVPLE